MIIHCPVRALVPRLRQQIPSSRLDDNEQFEALANVARDPNAVSITIRQCRADESISDGTYQWIYSSYTVYNNAVHTRTTLSVNATTKRPVSLPSTKTCDFYDKIGSISNRKPYGTTSFL